MSAIIPYLQPGAITNAQSDITDLQALSGMPDNSLNLGTFTGDTIPDSQTTKHALQALETEVEERLPDFVQWRVGTGPGYRTEVSSNYVTVSSGWAKIGTSDFTIVSFVDPDGRARTAFRPISRATSDGIYATWTTDTTFAVLVGADSYSFTVPYSSYSDGPHVYVLVGDRDGNLSLYIDGNLIGSQSFANSTGDNIIGDLRAAGGLYHQVHLLNRAVTEAEAQLLSRGQSLGYADVGADGAALYSHGFEDDAFTGWGKFEFGSATATLSVTGSEFNLGAKSLQAAIVIDGSYPAVRYDGGSASYIQAGKRYRAKFAIKSDATHTASFIVNSSAGLDVTSAFSNAISVTTSWQEYTFEFVAAADSRYLGFRNFDANSNIYIDDFDISPIGEVLRLTGNGAAPTIWADESGNGYNTTVTGATLIYQRALHADSFVSFTNLPTSSAGLATGQVWNDSGTLKIV